MKNLVFIFICILMTQNGYCQNNQLKKLDIKVYFNDTEIKGSVYDNGTKQNIYENYSNSYVSLVDIFNLLDSKVVIDGNLIKITSQKLGNFEIFYDSPKKIIFNPRPYPFPSTDNSIIVVDNNFYIRINMVRYIISGYIEEDEEKVTLYSRDYERLNMPVLNIKAYLNNVEIDGPVYKNVYSPPVQGINYLSSFVKLSSIFHALGAEVKISNRIIEINGKKTGKIIINYVNQINISINSTSKNEKLANNSIVIINNEYFIQISIVRYLINGALKQDENSVTLYTNDFDRKDIPLNLNDCYIALNNLLDEQTRNKLKTSSVENLIMYHMGLGMWIRNNWLRQSNSRITGTLYNKGLRDFDDMSQIIIIGYYYYLNGINKSIEELRK